MNRAHSPAMLRWLLLSLAVLAAGCTELGMDPHVPTDGEAQLRVHVQLEATSVTRVAVEVAAADMETLTFELDVADDAASGTLSLPAGSDRTITLQAYDASDIETHRGSSTVDIEEGSNPELVIVLDPLTGEQPIEAVLAEAILESVSPHDLIFLADETIQLEARVVDSDGNPVDVPVRWAVVQPSEAEVTADGQLSLVDPTIYAHTATIVAALGTQYREAQITFMSQQAVADLVDEHLAVAYGNWWQITAGFNGGAPALSAASFQHSTSVANFGMNYYSLIPRQDAFNSTANRDYGIIAWPFDYAYTAIEQVHETYALMGHFVDRGMFDAGDEYQVWALGEFIEGLSYGTLALRYDSGPILGLHQPLVNATAADFVGYSDLLQYSLDMLDEAITTVSLSTGFEIPEWVLNTYEPVTAERLASLAHSYKARFRAGAARTPTERDAVDWSAVLEDIGFGIDSDHVAVRPGDLTLWQWYGSLYYTWAKSWSQMSYFVNGMADQSGRYQEWMGLPVEDRQPDLSGGAFIMETPDQRFPQGTTVDEQIASPGSLFEVPSDYYHGWHSPDRGTWRWSYYRTVGDPNAPIESVPEMTVAEMDLLAAEAYYRLGDPATAADLVNITRTAAGLTATDGSGTNVDCVPRLPDGSCGDLLEMIKWEKRLALTQTQGGYFAAGWYFEGRGWGDLMEGTPLQWPVPAHWAEYFGVPVVDYGGGLDFSAPVGTYGY